MQKNGKMYILYIYLRGISPLDILYNLCQVENEKRAFDFSGEKPHLIHMDRPFKQRKKTCNKRNEHVNCDLFLNIHVRNDKHKISALFFLLHKFSLEWRYDELLQWHS